MEAVGYFKIDVQVKMAGDAGYFLNWSFQTFIFFIDGNTCNSYYKQILCKHKTLKIIASMFPGFIL